MFLQLNHKNLVVYKIAGQLLIECYRLTLKLPTEERYNLVQQIRRAALSVKLNIAEGASRKSVNERKRFFEIARGSIVELDAAFEVTIALRYLNEDEIEKAGNLNLECFKILSKLTPNS